MKLVVVGGSRLSDVASAPFRDRDSVELGLARDFESGLDVVAGRADAVLLAPLSLDDEIPAFPPETNVVVLTSDTDPQHRANVFAAGARDVILPPFTPERIENAVASALGRPLRRWKRCSTPLSAKIAVPDRGRKDVAVVDLSAGGVQVRAPEAIDPGVVFQIAIRFPARTAVLFARAIASEHRGDGAFVVRAQFVGMTLDETEMLEAFLDSLAATVEGFAVQLRALQKLDLRRVRTGYANSGSDWPPLNACEKTWLAADPGTREADLVAIPIARVRAVLIARLFDAFFAAGEEAPPGIPPFRQWRGELKMAQDLLHQEISRGLAAGDAAGVRDLRDLEAKLNNTADQIERLQERVTGQKRQVVKAPIRDSAVRREHAELDDVADEAVEVAASATAGDAKPALFHQRVLQHGRAIRIGIIVVFALLAFHEHASDDERHTVYPSSKVEAATAVLQVGPVHVRSIYRQNGKTIAVVDGSWFDLSKDMKMWVLKSLANKEGVVNGRVLEIRDYAGDLLANWYGGAKTPDPGDPPAS